MLILVCIQGTFADTKEEAKPLFYEGPESVDTNNIYLTHSCIHDEILHQRRRSGRKEYSVTPQVYVGSTSSEDHRKGRTLLGVSEEVQTQSSDRQPIRIYLNYDAVGHSPDRDCQKVGDIVKVLVDCFCTKITLNFQTPISLFFLQFHFIPSVCNAYLSRDITAYAFCLL